MKYLIKALVILIMTGLGVIFGYHIMNTQGCKECQKQYMQKIANYYKISGKIRSGLYTPVEDIDGNMVLVKKSDLAI